jgi:hypothetical protein
LHKSLKAVGAYKDEVDISKLGTEAELSANGSTGSISKVQLLAEHDLASRFEVAQNLDGEQQLPAASQNTGH